MSKCTNLLSNQKATLIKFSYTILYVKDVSATVAFYEKAFDLKQRFVDESGQYAEMETSETTFSFTAVELAKSNLPQGFQENTRSSLPPGIEVGFVTDDVAATFTKAVAAGAVAVVEPKTKPWGQIVSYVRDLDGVLIEVCSPI